MKQRNRERLFNKNFLLLWQGQFISNIGSQVFEIAMMLWIKGKTGIASLMGLFLMVSSIADLCCAPIGGVFADMYSRKKIIVITDAISGIIVLFLTLLFILLPHTTILQLFFVFVTAIILGSCMSFFDPAVDAFIPDLVAKKKLTAANSLLTGGEQSSLLIGQAIGGLLYSFVGPIFASFINGSSYMCSAFSETFIKDKKAYIKKSSFSIKSMFTQIKQGLHFIWKRKGLRNAALMISVHNFFIMPLLVILPFYLELSLKMGPEWYGFLLACFSFGNIIGFLIAGIILDLINKNTNLLLLIMGSTALTISCLIFFNKAVQNLLAYETD